MTFLKHGANYAGIAMIILSVISCDFSPKPLFNGADLEGWYQDIPANDTLEKPMDAFVVREGNLVSLGTPRGHLLTNTLYKNYRLTLEYRFPKTAGNSGILVHTSVPRVLYGEFPKSIEIQLMHENAGDFWCIAEDIEVENMEAFRGPKSEWGTLAGKARRIKNRTDDSERSIGEWNSVVIECIENEIKVWVNSDMVNHGFNATVSEGKIALQSEGSEVIFRDIELTPISTFTK